MKFTRKMILVDYDKYMTSNQPKQELDVTAKPLFSLNKEMVEILNKNNVSDSIKYKKYLKKLNRYLFLAKNKPISEKIKAEREKVIKKLKEIKKEPKIESKNETEPLFEEEEEEAEEEKAAKSISEESDESQDFYASVEEENDENFFGKVSTPKKTKRDLNIGDNTPTNSNTINVGSPQEFLRLMRSRPAAERQREISKWTNYENITKPKKK
jgi:hypothetical protein